MTASVLSRNAAKWNPALRAFRSSARKKGIACILALVLGLLLAAAPAAAQCDGETIQTCPIAYGETVAVTVEVDREVAFVARYWTFQGKKGDRISWQFSVGGGGFYHRFTGYFDDYPGVRRPDDDPYRLVQVTHYVEGPVDGVVNSFVEGRGPDGHFSRDIPHVELDGEVYTSSLEAELGSDGEWVVGVFFVGEVDGPIKLSGKLTLQMTGDPPMRISNCVSTATDTWFKLTLLGSEIEAGDALHVSIKAEDGAAFRHLLEVPRAVLTQEEKEEELLAAGEGAFVSALVGEIPLADVIYNTAKTLYDVKKAVSDWNAKYAASEALSKYQEFSAVLTEDATKDREFLIHGRHENGGKMTVELTRRGVSVDENDTVVHRTAATPVCQYSH